MKNSNFKSKLGFTLVELLVVIAIMSTLAATIFPKIGQYSSAQALNQGAQGFIGVIRATQANAISGTLCGDSYYPVNKAVYWGFYADPSLANFFYQPNCVDSSGNPVASLPKNIFNYASGVKVKYVDAIDSSGAATGCSNGITVGFDNISGRVEFLNTSSIDPCEDPTPPLVSNFQKMRYTISTTSSTDLMYVFVDRSGSVYSSQTP